MALLQGLFGLKHRKALKIFFFSEPLASVALNLVALPGCLISILFNGRSQSPK